MAALALGALGAALLPVADALQYVLTNLYVIPMTDDLLLGARAVVM